MAFFDIPCLHLRKNQILNQKESTTSCSSLPITLQPTSLAMVMVSEDPTATNFASAISPHEDIHQAKATDKKEILSTEQEYASSCLQLDFLTRLIEPIKLKKELQTLSPPLLDVGALLIQPVGSAKKDSESDNESQVARPANFATLTPFLKHQESGTFSAKASITIITESLPQKVFKWSVEKTLAKFLALTIQDSKSGCHVNPEAVWFVNVPTQLTPCIAGMRLLLAGPITLVLEETEVVTQAMKRHVGKRKETANALAAEKPLEIPRGQIIRFSWGQEDSPVHSEPDLVAERVFISCIYGSISEIKDITATRRQKIGDLQAQFRTEIAVWVAVKLMRILESAGTLAEFGQY
ncbi:hypothetical protein H4I96_04126 [Botrytis cinerea]